MNKKNRNVFLMAVVGLVTFGGCQTTGGHSEKVSGTVQLALDTDGDGLADQFDLCPNHTTDWTDEAQAVDMDLPCEVFYDCLGDTSDLDANGDSLPEWDMTFVGLGSAETPTPVCHEGACFYERNSDKEGWADACDGDNDSDGVLDEDDNCPTVDNPLQIDNDGDTCASDDDACDVTDSNGGDACDDDDDNDGVLDDEDNCQFVENGDQTDTDGDCADDPEHCGDACDGDADGDDVPNDEDNCPLVSNTDQANNDGDADGDVCDEDDDNDGVSDVDDNCPLTENADQADTDADDLGDVCDDDDDDDGVDDVDDNCPLTENADQLDTDGDEAGDVCDDDDDDDGIEDDADNCPVYPNPGQGDADADDIGDVCDTDCDGSGIDDAWYLGMGFPNLQCSPGHIDSDGDGYCPVGTDLNGDSDCVDIGELTVQFDCNDGDGDTYPGAAEVCDTIDNDCDGETNEGSDEELCGLGFTCTGDPASCVALPPECATDDECADDDSDACNGVGVCDEGVCVIGDVVNCDDHNDCTDDSCDPDTGECGYVDNSDACDDGSACTDGDICVDGSCKSGDTVTCDDGNACTDDSCDSETGCEFANNSDSCDDGNACTDSDVCHGGACNGSAVTCDDSNACTDDSCDSETGCEYVDNTDACDDDDACTTGDVCSGGSCAGTDVVCEDGETCVSGVCEEPCTSECTDMDCGSDGCGGTCGTCEEEEVCSFAGQCHEQGMSTMVVDVDLSGSFTIWLMYSSAPIQGDRKDAPASYEIPNATLELAELKANAFDEDTFWLGCDLFLAGLGGLEDMIVTRNGFRVIGTPTQSPFACGGEGQGDLVFTPEDLCLPGYDTDDDGTDNEDDSDIDDDGVINEEDVCPCYSGTDKGCEQP